MTGTSVPEGLGNIHHVAFRCRDAEQTRWFYEEVLGLKLAAALAFSEEHGHMLGRPGAYMHLFFELGDGNFIAFFDEPGTATETHFERKDSFDMHIALEVSSMEELSAYQQRINARGKSCLGPVDHGFVHSVYMYDPNGIQVEITCKAVDYQKIMAEEEQSARTEIARWCEETRAQKLSKFGSAIDQRGKPTDQLTHL